MSLNRVRQFITLPLRAKRYRLWALLLLPTAGCLTLKNPANLGGHEALSRVEITKYFGSGQSQWGWRTDLTNRTYTPTFTIALGPSGELYLADYSARVVKISSTGAVQGWLGSGRTGWHFDDPKAGSEDGYLTLPYGLVATSSYLYFTDRYTHSVIRYTLDGQFSGWIGGGQDGWRYGTRPSTSGTGLRDFNGPQAVTTDGTYLYIVDGSNHRVMRWKADDGTFQGWMGGGQDNWQYACPCTPTAATTNGSFNSPASIHYDPTSNRLFVGEKSRVQKWDLNATREGWIGSGADSWQTGSTVQTGNGDRYFGDSSNATNAAAWIFGIATDENGYLYASDTYNHRIHVWKISDGTYKGWYGNGSNGLKSGAGANPGSKMGFLTWTAGLALDRTNNYLYSLNRYNGITRLTVADTANPPADGGNFAGFWGTNSGDGWMGSVGDYMPGKSGFIENGYYSVARSMAMDGSGNFYIAEAAGSHSGYTGHLMKFDTDGNPVGWLGGGLNGFQTGSANWNRSANQGGFAEARDIVTTSTHIYATDPYFHRINRWALDGTKAGWIGGGSDGWQTADAAAAAGSSAKQFNLPLRMAIDEASEMIYVADFDNVRVVRWKVSDGTWGWIGSGNAGWQTSGAAGVSGSGDGYFNKPAAVAFSKGKLYVCDILNHRVQKWDATAGTFEGWIGGGQDGWQTGGTSTSGTGDRYFSMNTYNHCVLTVDEAGKALYVGDSTNRRIQKWSVDGTYYGWIGSGTPYWTRGEAPQYSIFLPYYTPVVYYLGIRVTADGTMYIANGGLNRIEIWKQY